MVDCQYNSVARKIPVHEVYYTASMMTLTGAFVNLKRKADLDYVLSPAVSANAVTSDRRATLRPRYTIGVQQITIHPPQMGLLIVREGVPSRIGRSLGPT